MCIVRVVLLCKGRGGDASSYRPSRDDTQWTYRRDALVRCVAAFLYGPGSNQQQQQREVILIHDEDYARMEMRMQPGVVPTEQAILSLWKAAAEQPHNNRSMHVENKGVSCRIVLDPSVPASTNTLPTSMDNKRQVLEYLQSHCSIEFLRQHRLNSSADVVLRKTNKRALMQVYRDWNEQQNVDSNKQERLSSIFQEMLKPIHSSIDKVVAGILHENSAAELPAFDVEPIEMTNLQVCLFLGAVRDMHPWENRVLSSCCSAAHVPLVRVRVGPVSEFTSKILSVVAHHHASGTLGPALLCLINNQNAKEVTNDSEPENASREPQRLQVVCFMPIPSQSLTCELSQRTRALWALIRVTVCTLWRSRLASNMDGSASPLQNDLTVLFEDGIAFSLEQDELVTSLAEQHQAAPCEYQILQALCKKRDEAVASHSGGWSETRATELLQRLLPEKSLVPSFVIDACAGQTNKNGELLTSLCSSVIDTKPMNGGQVLLLLRIRTNDIDENGISDMEKHVREACAKRGIPILRESLASQTVQDNEAATVTLVQHFIYQRRLFPALKHAMPEQQTHLNCENGKKRRKKDKTARKERKKKKKKRSND